jgi:hypothetical protein
MLVAALGEIKSLRESIGVQARSDFLVGTANDVD